MYIFCYQSNIISSTSYIIILFKFTYYHIMKNKINIITLLALLATFINVGSAQCTTNSDCFNGGFCNVGAHSCICVGVWRGPICTERATVVFITPLDYTVDQLGLGGLVGADATCQVASATAFNIFQQVGTVKPGNIWKAWLSNGTQSAASRMDATTNVYEIMGPSGEPYASSWSSLLSIGASSMLFWKQVITGSDTTTYWTATNSNGQTHVPSGDCGNWHSTTSPDTVVVGRNAFISEALPNTQWSAYLHQTCNSRNRLLCVLQKSVNNACGGVSSSPSTTCLNGGTCVPDHYSGDPVSNYVCNCPTGFSGRNCEVNIDDCVSQPCQHGGSCIDGVNSYKCQCPPLYEGTKCELLNNVDDCASVPCQHGATCVDTYQRYICQCAYPWFGTQCQTCPTANNDFGLCTNNVTLVTSCTDFSSTSNCGACGATCVAPTPYCIKFPTNHYGCNTTPPL